MIINSSASLSIKSLTHPAAAVTKVLRIDPSATAERGDPVGRVRTGSDGKPSMRERTHSIWVLDAPDAEPGDATGFSGVRALVATMEPKRKALDKLRESYFIEVVWNGYSDRLQTGFLIPADLLAAMGSLGCDFHGTVYLKEAGDDAQPEAAGSTHRSEIPGS